MDAKSFLKQYQKMCKRCEAIRRRIRQTEDDIGSITVNLDGMPRGTQTSDSVAAYIAQLEMMRDELMQKLAEKERVKREIEAVLDELEKPEHGELLELRYVVGWGWLRIAEHMGYSSQYVRERMHRAALDAVTRILGEEYGTERDTGESR